MKRVKKTYSGFPGLVLIMRKLLSASGCPWDRKQTHETLLKYLREEAGEFERAVKKKDFENMKEELGDLLLQIVFHSELARIHGRFDIDGVVSGINEKLLRRHPHVFGGKKLKTAGEVVKLWNKIKKKEKKFPGVGEKNEHRK